jgi:galactitol-specific phosphotransferase system IIB component
MTEWMLVKIDVTKVDEAADMMRGYDVVMDGTQITLNGLSTECIAKAGCQRCEPERFRRREPVG